jgi:flagellar motor switch protein FliG
VDDNLAASPSAALTGAQKALLFLVSIDESAATRIVAQLDVEELACLRRTSDTLAEVDPETLLSVHREFAELVRRGVPASLKGSSAYLRRLAGKALGEGRVADVWDDRPKPMGPVAKLAELDTGTLLSLLEDEKPQTLAVILMQLEPSRAAELLARMPTSLQADVALRMARLKDIPEVVIDDIARQFESEIALLGSEKRRPVDGLASVSAIVKRLESDASDELLQDLTSLDEALATRIRENLFTFEDLLRVDGRGMQVLLKEIATDQLVIALKGASDDLKEKVFGNVSSRAANMLRDELDMLGPVKLGDVEESQRSICAVALKLEQDGRIQIAREGAGDYV